MTGNLGWWPLVIVALVLAVVIIVRVRQRRKYVPSVTCPVCFQHEWKVKVYMSWNSKINMPIINAYGGAMECTGCGNSFTCEREPKILDSKGCEPNHTLLREASIAYRERKIRNTAY